MSTSTDLAIYDRIANPMEAVKQFGLSIAQSGTFGTSNNAQGEVLALECMSLGIPPLTLAKRFHFISNKLSMKAEAMLAAFNERGGKHVEICSSPEKAEIEITFDGRTKTYSLTWEQCRQEPFVYDGKESEVVKKLLAGDKGLTLKPKYSTPRARAQMMWARLISDTIRKVMPEVICGTYTPEEIDDFDEVTANGNGSGRTNGKSTKAAATPVLAAALAQQQLASPVSDPAVVDAEIIEPATTATPTVDSATKLRIQQLLRELGITNPGWDIEMMSPDAAGKQLKQLEQQRLDLLKKQGAERTAEKEAEQNGATNGSTVTPANGGCTAQQSDRIKELWGLIGATPDQRTKMLAKRGVNAVRSLTGDQAVELIGKLEGIHNEAEAEKAKAAAETDPETTQAAIATPEQVAGLKERLLQMDQMRSGYTKEVRATIEAAGYTTLDQLSYADVAALLSATYTDDPWPAAVNGKPWPMPKAELDILCPF